METYDTFLGAFSLIHCTVSDDEIQERYPRVLA